MSQYFPAYRAAEIPELSRRLSSGEYEKAKNQFLAAGLTNGWVQELDETGPAA